MLLRLIIDYVVNLSYKTIMYVTCAYLVNNTKVVKPAGASNFTNSNTPHKSKT